MGLTYYSLSISKALHLISLYLNPLISQSLHTLIKCFQKKAVIFKPFLCNTLSDKNSSDKIVKISAWCRKFCPTKNFVRRKFCPMFQYKSQAKIGQKCRNFGRVSKILSDEIFCPIRYIKDFGLFSLLHWTMDKIEMIAAPKYFKYFQFVWNNASWETKNVWNFWC